MISILKIDPTDLRPPYTKQQQTNKKLHHTLQSFHLHIWPRQRYLTRPQTPPPPYEKLYNENEKLRWAAIFVRETDIDVWANDEEDILNSVNWRCRSDKWYFKLVPHSKRGRKIEYLTPPGPNKRRAGRCYTDYITLLYTDRSRLIWALPSCLLLYVLVGWGRITFSGLSNIKYGNENSTDKI